MVINGLSGADTNSQLMYGAGQVSDAYSRSIQKQIADVQKQMQELSSNGDMTMEEKMKKRQELQQEISSLNQQLRLHQAEQTRKQQAKGYSMEDMLGGSTRVRRNTGKSCGGIQAMSHAEMTAIISADISMGQVNVQKQVKSGLEGRAGVLKAEIKQDAGGNTEAKEAELADLEDKVNGVAASQMNTLSDINTSLKEAAKADSKSEETEKKGQNEVSASETKTDESDTDESVSQEVNSVEAAELPSSYSHVDVML